MIPLNIEQNNNFVTMNFKEESDYFEIFDELEEGFHKRYFGPHFWAWRQTHKKEYEAWYKDEVVNAAHRQFFNSCTYSLRELLNHFKAITKIYGDYLVLDYQFRGVFLRKNDDLVHCYIGSDEEEFEEMSSDILGKTLSEFVKVLTAQKRLGDIAVKYIKVDLLHNKKSKPKRKRTHIPRGLRHEVFKRDNYTCVECGARKEDGATLHVDHKIPVSKGGTDELSNLQTLCSDCNLNKSDVIQ